MGQGCAQQVLLSTLTLLDLFALLLRVQGSVFVSVSAFVSLCVNVPRARCCDGAWHMQRELVAGQAAAAAAAVAVATAVATVEEWQRRQWSAGGGWTGGGGGGDGGWAVVAG